MQVIQTNNAPSAIGTYSQAVLVNQTLYLSGQIPLNPITMEVVSEEIEKQIEQVFLNLSAVCEAAGGSLNSIVKLTIYLTDLKQFSKVNECMATFFTAPYPARAVIEISALPLGVQIEVDGIMVVPSS